jgi:hypothetical protein
VNSGFFHGGYVSFRKLLVSVKVERVRVHAEAMCPALPDSAITTWRMLEHQSSRRDYQWLLY